MLAGQITRLGAGLRTRTAQWLRPEMTVRTRCLKGGDKLRHATVAGLPE